MQYSVNAQIGVNQQAAANTTTTTISKFFWTRLKPKIRKKMNEFELKAPDKVF